MREMMTGKRALLEMLKAEGVRYIFGNPGTSEGPIIDMLVDYPQFTYILTLQESVAVGMGEAFARATQTGIVCQPACGQRSGQWDCPDAGRVQYGDPDGGHIR